MHTFATVTLFPCFHYSLVYIDHSSIPFRRIKPRNQTSPPLGVDILQLTFLEEPGERCHSYSTENKDASQWIYEMVKCLQSPVVNTCTGHHQTGLQCMQIKCDLHHTDYRQTGITKLLSAYLHIIFFLFSLLGVPMTPMHGNIQVTCPITQQ